MRERSSNSMLETYRVSLFGHRQMHNLKTLEESLYPVLSELMKSHAFVEFYVGRNGAFDEFAASVVKRIQKECGQETSELTLVLPCSVKDVEYFEKYYDNILFPVKAHYKAAITKRNEWMIDNSDLVVCYVERESGGAYSAMKYAYKRGKQIINLVKKDGLNT